MGVFAVLLWWMLVYFLFRKILKVWLKEKQAQFTKDWQWVILAVDVPPALIQSPKAVEQIFVHLSGAFSKINVFDKYMKGKSQEWFSFEIISIEGYIQFVVRTELKFRDLVEAAIYAQYTGAEITEVEDYADRIPDKFPNEEFDFTGVEFNLANHHAYPIHTHPHFEYSSSLDKEGAFIDPMAAVLENFTRIGPGENFWMQLVVSPSDNSWKQEGIDLVKEIIEGKKKASKGSIANKVAGLPMMALNATVQAWNMDSASSESVIKKEPVVGKVSDLTPGKRQVVEAVEEKISKFGFHSRLRIIYTAKKNVFNPQKCLYGFVGAMNQFYTADKNSLVPDYIKPTYLSKDEKFIAAFKKRSFKFKTAPYILNIEELATLWHFPMPSVKTPLLQKSSLKKGEPPINLPMDTPDNFFEEISHNPLTVVEEEKLPYA
jgi:hypothetical protein